MKRDSDSMKDPRSMRPLTPLEKEAIAYMFIGLAGIIIVGTLTILGILSLQ